MKNNAMALGLIFGAGIGINIGVLTDNLAIWLSIFTGVGIALGAAYGTYLKEQKRNCKAKNPELESRKD